MQEDMGCYLIVMSIGPLPGFSKITYRIPVEQIYTRSEAEELARKLSKKLSNVLDWQVIRILVDEYNIYYRLADLHDLMSYTPKIADSNWGRDYNLEEVIREKFKKEYIKLMDRYDINYKTEAVIGVRELLKF